jgi:hypothetical protein
MTSTTTGRTTLYFKATSNSRPDVGITKRRVFFWTLEVDKIPVNAKAVPLRVGRRGQILESKFYPSNYILVPKVVRGEIMKDGSTTDQLYAALETVYKEDKNVVVVGDIFRHQRKDGSHPQSGDTGQVISAMLKDELNNVHPSVLDEEQTKEASVQIKKKNPQSPIVILDYYKVVKCPRANCPICSVQDQERIKKTVKNAAVAVKEEGLYGERLDKENPWIKRSNQKQELIQMRDTAKTAFAALTTYLDTLDTLDDLDKLRDYQDLVHTLENDRQLAREERNRLLKEARALQQKAAQAEDFAKAAKNEKHQVMGLISKTERILKGDEDRLAQARHDALPEAPEPKEEEKRK